MQDILSPPKGRLQLFNVASDALWTPASEVTLNTVLYEWGFIAAKTIGQGDPAYRVNMMYIEYENTSGSITAPTIDRAEGLTYYSGLSGNKDYLRVPLIGQPTISIEAGFESYFMADVTGNLLTFFAQSTGTTGVLSNAFSNAANSKIYGAALVAAPVAADSTKDIVFSRAYFASSDQTVKQASSQVGITWELPFE